MRTDRARHASAAQPAVAVNVARKVLLVVALRRKELAALRWEELRRDLAVAEAVKTFWYTSLRAATQATPSPSTALSEAVSPSDPLHLGMDSRRAPRRRQRRSRRLPHDPLPPALGPERLEDGSRLFLAAAPQHLYDAPQRLAHLSARARWSQRS